MGSLENLIVNMRRTYGRFISTMRFPIQNVFENIVWKMAAILSRSLCVKETTMIHSSLSVSFYAGLYDIKWPLKPLTIHITWLITSPYCMQQGNEKVNTMH